MSLDEDLVFRVWWTLLLIRSCWFPSCVIFGNGQWWMFYVMWCTPVHREVSFSSEPLYESFKGCWDNGRNTMQTPFHVSIHYHPLLQITLSNALHLREYERKDLLVVSLQVSFMKIFFFGEAFRLRTFGFGCLLLVACLLILRKKINL